MEIKKLKSTIEDNGLKAIIYGKSGVGKTTLIGTLKEGKTLILSAESGLLSIADKNHDVVEVKNMEQLREAYEFLTTEKHGYENVAMDSLTEISIIKVSELEQEYVDAKDTFKMWGDYDKSMRKLVRLFRDLPLNVFFIALVEDVKDGEYLVKKPAIKGSKLQGELQGYFDEVFYINIGDDGERRIHVNPSSTYDSKDRSSKLVEGEVPFNLEEIKKIIKGK